VGMRGDEVVERGEWVGLCSGLDEIFNLESDSMDGCTSGCCVDVESSDETGLDCVFCVLAEFVRNREDGCESARCSRSGDA
jgi:hypothetical protein